MGSLSRKMKRARMRKQQKKDLNQKMGMFDRLPDECSACEKPFDKRNKEMVMSWNVVVRAEEKIVRLYCPECWGKAKEVVEEFGK